MRIFKRLTRDGSRSTTFTSLARCLAALAIACIAMSANGLDTSGERGPLHMARNLAEDPSNARVIVRFRSDSTLRQALAGRSGAPVQRAPQHASVLAARIRVPLSDGRVLGPHTQQIRGTGISSSQLARQLAGMPDVAWATVDERRFAHAAPNDPYFGPGQTVITPTVGQWYLRAPDSSMVSAINALGAWSISTGSPSVTVAVLDTGVRKDHPDLAGKLHEGYDFLADSSSSNDGDGRDPDASDPGDFMVAGQCGAGALADTSSWHGTQVAGIVGAATHNGLGIAGAGRDIMVLPVRVLGACGGYDADIIAAMRWAAGISSDVGGGVSVTNAHPAKVINLSLGSSSACGQAYIDAVQELNAAGVTVVASAGNAAGFATDAPGNCPGVLAVGGLRHTGTKVGFSSLGPDVAISAPAGNCVNVGGNEPCLYPIMTTSNAGTTTPAASIYTDSFNYSLGTSFSAPQVSGTVGLMLSIHPNLTPDAVRAALQASARAFPPALQGSGVAQCHAPNSHEQYECACTTSTCGAGMLDAAAAVAWVLPAPQAVVDVDTSALQSSHRAMLSGLGSLASEGRSIAHFQWSLLSGQPYANFLGTTSSSTATLQFVGVGGVVDVQLEVTDSTGATASNHLRIEGPIDTPPTPAGPSGGGGTTSALFLAGLMLACMALWRMAKAG